MPAPRRDLLALSALSLAGALTTFQTSAQEQVAQKQPTEQKPASKDRDFVIAAGMTEKEADCWEFAAKTAGAFFDLPEMHPMDKTEIATAIHVIQNKLLSRPTYRKYLENAKAARDDSKAR